MNCRHCGLELDLPLVDLGSAPPSNAYLTEETLRTPERWFPLRVLVCQGCWLVQTEDFAQAHELFDENYAYFSGCSKSWLEHSELYVQGMVERFGLGPEHHVVEVAANDGYLLQFVKSRNIPCIGIEPTAMAAAAAREKGITIIEDFFGTRLAREMVDRCEQADLTIANNVLAHVPAINDFVAGFAELLKPQGVATFEFPHLLDLIENTQFDTIYHEHYSYLSLTSVNQILSANGLTVFDVEHLSTHGGSLRVFAQRSETGQHSCSPNVKALLNREAEVGITTPEYYAGFQARANEIKDNLLTFLLTSKRQGKSVVAYGAAAKGNTLMNYAGIRSDLIRLVVDRNPAKQGKYMPGSRIPIVAEPLLKEAKPDYVLILPWNLRAELAEQLEYVEAWGGQIVTAVPVLEVGCQTLLIPN